MHAHVADRLTRSPGLTARSHQCQSDTLGAASPHRRTWRQRARAGPVTQSQRAWREMRPRSSLRGPRPPCSGQRGWGPMRTASSVSTRKDCRSPDCEGTNRFHTVIKRCLQSDRCPQPGNSAARQKPRAGARLSPPLWCHGRGRHRLPREDGRDPGAEQTWATAAAGPRVAIGISLVTALGVL